MNREAAKANLEKLGFTDVTEDQITNYLNQLEGETNGLKTKLAKAEKEAKDVTALRQQIEDLENSKLTDDEKAAKETAKAAETIANLEKQVAAMELKNKLANQGITGENADKLVESLNSGSLDVELLGSIITNRETEAARKKEEEIANKSTNPGGGSAGSDEGGNDDNGVDKTIVSSVAAAIGGGEKSTSDIVASYM